VRGSGKAGRVVVFATDFSVQLAEFLLCDDDIFQAVTAQEAVEVGRRPEQAAVDVPAGRPMEKKFSLSGALLCREQPD